MLALADQYLRLVDFSAYYAVSCLDSSWPTDPGEHLDAAGSAATRAPRFGEAIVNDYLRCAVWPTDADPLGAITAEGTRSEEHTSELQSLMRISYAVFCLKKKKKQYIIDCVRTHTK